MHPAAATLGLEQMNHFSNCSLSSQVTLDSFLTRKDRKSRQVKVHQDIILLFAFPFPSSSLLKLCHGQSNCHFKQSWFKQLWLNDCTTANFLSVCALMTEHLIGTVFFLKILYICLCRNHSIFSLLNSYLITTLSWSFLCNWQFAYSFTANQIRLLLRVVSLTYAPANSFLVGF